MHTSESLIFLVKTVVECRNLQISKTVNTYPKRIFPIPFKVAYISLRYSWFENNSSISSFGYLFNKCFCFFINSRYLREMIMIKKKWIIIHCYKNLCYITKFIPKCFWLKHGVYKTNACIYVGWCFITAFPTTSHAKKL